MSFINISNLISEKEKVKIKVNAPLAYESGSNNECDLLCPVKRLPSNGGLLCPVRRMESERNWQNCRELNDSTQTQLETHRFTTVNGHSVVFKAQPIDDTGKTLVNISRIVKKTIECHTVKIPNDVKYLSDYITDFRLKTWIGKDYIFIATGTGSGKTTFITKKMIDGMLGKIAYFINRNITLFQVKNKVDSENCFADIYTYQAMEAKRNFDSDYFENYSTIVIDEAHYFIHDAKYNSGTNLSLERILKSNSLKIFISSTIDDIRSYVLERHAVEYGIDNMEDCFINYETTNSNLLIRKIIKIHSIEEILSDIQNSSEKWLIFNRSLNQLNDIKNVLSDNLKDKSIGVLCRDLINKNNRKAKKIYDSIVNENFFSEDILLTTALLDNGTSIEDDKVKNIVCMDFNPVEIIQEIGRKRICNENDFMDLYLLEESKDELYGLKGIELQKLQAYETARELLLKKEKVLVPIEFILNGKQFDCLRDSIYVDFDDNWKIKINKLGKLSTIRDLQNIEALLHSDSAFDLKVNLVTSRLSQYPLIESRTIDNENSEVLSEEECRTSFMNLVLPFLGNTYTKSEWKEREIQLLISQFFFTFYGTKGTDRFETQLGVQNLNKRFNEYNIPVFIERKGMGKDVKFTVHRLKVS